MKEKFRISDIFKKSKIGKGRSSHGIRFHQAKPEQTTQSQQEPQDRHIRPSVPSKTLISSPLYTQAVQLAQKIYSDQGEKSNLAKGVYASVKEMINLITAGDTTLLKTALADYSQPEEYLYYHVVNVCIISLHIGLGLNYDDSRLNELGIAAFFHDIGLSKYMQIIKKPKRLKLQEISEVKQHPLIGTQMLNKISESLNQSIFEVILKEHERIDGSGYPNQLQEDEILEYAQIVGLSDVYEAMIHSRPYRAKHTPLEVIKSLLEKKYSFANKLIKVLIERIGIFPVGTFVMLNTKEVAQVLKGNIDSPLRPIVEITFDATGRRLKETRQIDLGDNPTTYIFGISSEPGTED
ncbi:MAG: HD domain-containing phosphohydrolase [Candidatus Omnitrophota bacterium]